MIGELVRHAASRYAVGPTADDASAVAERLARHGYACTICYWDSGLEPPERVATEYARAARAARALDGYVSVKATALGFSSELIAPLAELGVKLHFDAMGPATVDDTRTLLEQLPGRLGTTLPGRWRRSDRDADWAVERGLAVRVVKGMWEGPDDRDPSAGFLSVVDRLAGRATFVAVATHDRRLAAEALSRLRAGGTPCELEQLYGLPRTPAPARVYLPYGTAWLPYALAHLRRRPRAAWWLARDLALASVSDIVGRSRPHASSARRTARPAVRRTTAPRLSESPPLASDATTRPPDESPAATVCRPPSRVAHRNL